MPLETSLEEARSEPDIAKIIFRYVKTQRAARAFIGWLHVKGGSCSRSELNRFSHMLNAGKQGVELSRTNFYKTVLHRLMDLGLIEIRARYDAELGRVIKVYGAVYQPIPKRRPPPGCWWRLAYLIALKWNREFQTSPGESDDTTQETR
jgi:hypothetical protein